MVVQKPMKVVHKGNLGSLVLLAEHTPNQLHLFE
jgi:hypothetical protein